MAIFILKLPVEEGAGARIDGTRAMLIEADSAADARSMATAQDEQDSDWSGASATDVTSLSASDYSGFVYRVRVSGSASADGTPDAVDVSYTGVGSDTIDLVGAALQALLNATSPIGGSLYTGGSNTLRVAQGSGNDDLGDRTLLVEITPPGASRPLAALVGTVNDQGASSADLDVVLAEPTAIPVLMEKL